MKIKKVRTSITIDPAILEAARDLVARPNSEYRSVAALIESALSEKVHDSLEPNTPVA